MKSNRKFSFAPEILGIIVTSIMILTFGSYFILDIIKNGDEALKVILAALIDWTDDPTGFFICYLIGYILVWWKPLLGSSIIILTSLLVALINLNNIGFVVFAIPTLLVGFFYFESWYKGKKAVNRH